MFCSEVGGNTVPPLRLYLENFIFAQGVMSSSNRIDTGIRPAEYNPFSNAQEAGSSEDQKNEAFTLHAPVEDIDSPPVTPPAPRKAPRTGKGVKEPRRVYMDESDDDDEPNLDEYFSGFANLDKKRKVAICRGYAAYLSASRQLPGKKTRK